MDGNDLEYIESVHNSNYHLYNSIEKNPS